MDSTHKLYDLFLTNESRYNQKDNKELRALMVERELVNMTQARKMVKADMAQALALHDVKVEERRLESERLRAKAIAHDENPPKFSSQAYSRKGVRAAQARRKAKNKIRHARKFRPARKSPISQGAEAHKARSLYLLERKLSTRGLSRADAKQSGFSDGRW